MMNLIERGQAMLNENKVKYAIECFSKAGETQPEAWDELSLIYAMGIGVEADKARADRLAKRARELITKNRQIRVRTARRRHAKNRWLNETTHRAYAA